MTLAITGIVGACTSTPPSGGRPPATQLPVGASSHSASSHSASYHGAPGSTAAARPDATRQQRILHASLEPWHLRQAVSREVVLADAGRLDIIGGLQRNDITTATVTTVNPADGASVAAPALARASHDAGGALLGGHAVVLGGGSAASADWIQQRNPAGTWRVIGALPAPRSDLTAATAGGTGYALGGYDGTRLDAGVVRIAQGGVHGVRATVIGRLSVPVRYPATAAVGNTLWVIGGRTHSGPTTVIQRFDIATGRASVTGHLHRPVEGASAVVLGREIYVCGGVVDGAPTAQVLRLDPSTGRIAPAGRLPARVSYAGAAVLGGSGYLVGGETPAISATVMRLQLAPPAGKR
jgi:hypothetical protein